MVNAARGCGRTGACEKVACGAPTGLPLQLLMIPTASRWATIFRPFGTSTRTGGLFARSVELCAIRAKLCGNNSVPSCLGFETQPRHRKIALWIWEDVTNPHRLKPVPLGATSFFQRAHRSISGSSRRPDCCFCPASACGCCQTGRTWAAASWWRRRRRR